MMMSKVSTMFDVKPNQLYRHYKGTLYKVLDIGKHTETVEELVIYQQAYVEGAQVWVRPLSMFSENVVVDNQVVPRFKLITPVTIEQVNQCITQANTILSSIYPQYKTPELHFLWTHAKSYWAKIHTTATPGRYELFISTLLFDQLDFDIQQKKLQETVLHELIHTLPRCMNHGKTFQKWVKRVNLAYPNYTITTKSSAKDYDIVLQAPVDRYIIKCNTCGIESKYARKPKVWKYLSNEDCPFVCSECGGKSFTGELLEVNK